MSIHLKKRSKLYRVLEDASLLELLFFGYLINDYQSLLVLDKISHHAIIGRVRNHANTLRKQFQLAHENYLQLMSSEEGKDPWIKIYKTPKGETKIHIPLSFKVKDTIRKCTTNDI